MKSNYTAPRADNEKEIYSLQSLEVKSVIVGPTEGAKLPAGRTPVWGWAWSGEGELPVSTSRPTAARAGRRDVHRSLDRYSWRKWEAEWDAKAGRPHRDGAASDRPGRIQPTSRAFNRLATLERDPRCQG